jgi:hypothetical protein
LTYKWFKSSIPNASNESWQEVTGWQENPLVSIDTSIIGTYYYRAVVRNTIKILNGDDQFAEATSNAATIEVDYPQASLPQINQDISDVEDVVGSIFSLTIDAEIIGDGEISYQWFISDNDVSNTDGMAIDGETDKTIYFDLQRPTTFYVYVEIYNTNYPNPIPAVQTSRLAKVQALPMPQATNFILSGNTPWIALIVVSIGLMAVSFIMITRKSVEIF